MASVTARGTSGHNTSATSFTLSPSGNFAAGSWAVLCLAVDNSEAAGVAHTTLTVTDSLGNTWTRRQSPLRTAAGQNFGVEGAIFTTPMAGGTLQSSTVITVTFGVNTTAKAWTLWEVVPGGTLSYVTGGNDAPGANTTTPTVTTGSITSGDVVIAACFNERGTAANITADGDSSNGAWSSAQATSVGTSGSNTGQNISSQYKVTTGTGTQTYNPTLVESSDVILAYIVLNDSGGGGGGAVTRSYGGFIG